MVQRKVANKLGIQADIHVKSEKQLGSLKPSSSCQHQDGKNKANTDLKKKMKRSRSFKLSDKEGLRSSPVTVRKTMAQPGKPPPLNCVSAATTPQSKSPIKAVHGSPNYMKSTSSSEAKKEISLVSSSRITQTASDSKINLRRTSSTSSKNIPGSCSKLARTSLTRTSSLKLVRKSPSFKPARASGRKCSRVALCTDMNVQKATCSSTLKESKFPAYLMLNPGGTESEGTSIIKVCPYTYCSLNGHHHTPLPPLKCFLRAKRRSMKTQRSTKIEALNAHKQKPRVAGAEELDNKPTSNEVDLDNSPMSPLIQEGHIDFFIEIYAKSKGNDAEANGGSTHMNAKAVDDFGCVNETAPEHDTDKPVSESLSEGSPHSEIDFDENLEGCGEFTSKDEATENLHEALKENGMEEDFRGILGIEESSPWKFNDGGEQECLSSINVDHTMFEVIDMEWDGWQYSASEPDDEAHSSMQTDDESDLNIGDLSESDTLKEVVISSNTSDSINITDEILADGVEQKVFEEDTASIDMCSQVSETLSYDQVSSIEEMSEVLEGKGDEEQGGKTSDTDLTGIVTTPSPTAELSEEQKSGKEKILEYAAPETVDEVSQPDPLLEVPENSCIIDMKDEVLESSDKFHSFEDYNSIQKPGDLEENETFTISDFINPEKELPSEAGEGEDRMEEGKVADAESLVGIRIFDLSHVLSGAEEDENADEINDNRNNNAIEAILSTQDTVDESLFAESQDHLSDSQHENTNIVIDKQSILEEDQDEAVFKVPTSKNSEEPKSSRAHDSASAEYDVAEKLPTTSDQTSQKSRSTFSFTRANAKEELLDDHNNRRWTIGRRRQEENEDEESRKFNPREPNFLPVVPEPEAEKVDLRHQMMDERKNAEEWMLDHALQQAVTKLTPARKKKVALLVEAFETVLPTTKCEAHLRHTSTGFGHGRPIQACN